jgi:hypothetical protein
MFLKTNAARFKNFPAGLSHLFSGLENSLIAKLIIDRSFFESLR